MEKRLAFWVVLMGLTGTLLAGGFESMSPRGDDTIQPVAPVDDQASNTQQFGPALAAAAVPEPSTLSLVAGAAIIGSGFCLRRRGRR